MVTCTSLARGALFGRLSGNNVLLFSVIYNKITENSNMRSQPKLFTQELQLSIQDLDFNKVLDSEYSYQQQLVKAIVNNGSMTLFTPDDIVRHRDRVIKIENYERYSKTLADACSVIAAVFKHAGPVTCHLFLSPAGASSFDLHTDPDDVVLFLMKGSKGFYVDESFFRLEVGEFLFIPHDIVHQAITFDDSVMLSFGLEKYISEKL